MITSEDVLRVLQESVAGSDDQQKDVVLNFNDVVK